MESDSGQHTAENQQERLLWVLSAATFLIFFQAYMLAPLIPRLAASFEVSAQTIGLAVPAYMIPYGISTLFYGLLSDRLGRRPILLATLDRKRAGQAMGHNVHNVFMLFTEFGLGSWIFGEALRFDWSVTLGLFSAVQLVAAVLADPLFQSKTPPQSTLFWVIRNEVLCQTKMEKIWKRRYVREKSHAGQR